MTRTMQWLEQCNLTMLGFKVLSQSIRLFPSPTTPSLTTQWLALITYENLNNLGHELTLVMCKLVRNGLGKNFLTIKELM